MLEMSSSLISIIIPVYNVDQYLCKCLDSVLGQTYCNLQVILVDDGSCDNSPAICDTYAVNDDRVRVVHQRNQGVGFARNTGINVANGDYLMFVDPDDYLPNDAVERLCSRIVHDNSDMVIGQYLEEFSDGTRELSVYKWLHDTVMDSRTALSLLGSKSKPIPCVVWAKLYKFSVFRNVRFTSLLAYEDAEIMPRILCACDRVSFTSDVVYYYFQRETSVMHNMTDELRIDCLSATLSVGRLLLDKRLIEAAELYYRGAVIIVANMENKNIGRNLLVATFSKDDVKQFKNKGTIFCLAWVGMYVPGIYPNTIRFLKWLKGVLRSLFHRFR